MILACILVLLVLCGIVDNAGMANGHGDTNVSDNTWEDPASFTSQKVFDHEDAQWELGDDSRLLIYFFMLIIEKHAIISKQSWLC